MSNRIYCYDTEFIDDGSTIELISIGMVCDDGEEYYAVNSDCEFVRVRRNDWLWANVAPHLPTSKKDWTDPQSGRGETILDRGSSLVRPKWVIANEVRDFITGCIPLGDRPNLWADHAAYGHVVLAQLFGPMVDLPAGVPMFTHELQQLREQAGFAWDLSMDKALAHNALEDARYGMRVYKLLTERLNPRMGFGYSPGIAGVDVARGIVGTFGGFDG